MTKTTANKVKLLFQVFYFVNYCSLSQNSKLGMKTLGRTKGDGDGMVGLGGGKVSSLLSSF